MPDRDAALSALHALLGGARANPDRILDAGAAAIARRLAEATDPDTDLTAAHALGLYHWLRWEVLPDGSDGEDLAAATRLFGPVYQVSPDSVPELLHHLLGGDDPGKASRDAGIELLTAYLTTGRFEQLTEAVARFRETLAALGAADAHRDNDLNNLVAALSVLAERRNDTDVVREAVAAGREAVAISRHHKLRVRYLDNLGGVLRLLAVRTGDLATLREAAEVAREAVAGLTSGHPRLAAFSSNLAATLQVLYQRAGELEVLEEAARAGRTAVAATPEGHPNRAVFLHNLGGTLVSLYSRTNRSDVLDEAVTVSRDAVAALPRDHPERASMTNGLAGTLGMLGEHTRDADILREGVRTERDAIAATPHDHPARAGYLHNLGLMLRTLFDLTGELDALAQAARAGRAAVAATTGDHPDHATTRYDLGSTLHRLHERTAEPEVLAEALECLRAAGASSAASTFVRLRARHALGQLATDPAEALRAMDSAIDLLELIAPGSLQRSDREHQLGRLGSLAGDAAAAALAAGNPARAVELLERARGVLAADAVGLRGADHERLRARYPDLAGQLDRARSRIVELDRTHATLAHTVLTAGSTRTLSAQLRQLAASRRAAHADWERAVAEAREHPGFAGFLRAPDIGQLTRHARDGPVVYVTAGHALVLTADPEDPVHVVALAGLTPRAAGVRATRLLAACGTANARDLAPAAARTAQQEIRAVLDWVWDTVTGPVLAHLGHTAAVPAGGPWPRVWWCPVGVLAFLPLHAAGQALDRVVSSYTPTARARNPEPAGTAPGTTVIVPVPDLPGAALPGVTEETAAIGALVPAASVLTNPTHDTVLAALPDHQVAHFACHGRADLADPARSHLVLADHATAPLTVTEIGALRLSAGLAYLSACATSVTAARLADEALHITGAFHLAGYHNVVGTLWSIDDTTAAEFAAGFYRLLTDDGTVAPRTGRSAAALHEVTRRLRERYPDVPAVWAAYTHTGA